MVTGGVSWEYPISLATNCQIQLVGTVVLAAGNGRFDPAKATRYALDTHPVPSRGRVFFCRNRLLMRESIFSRRALPGLAIRNFLYKRIKAAPAGAARPALALTPTSGAPAPYTGPGSHILLGPLAEASRRSGSCRTAVVVGSLSWSRGTKVL